jgi:hypothetical protein
MGSENCAHCMKKKICQQDKRGGEGGRNSHCVDHFFLFRSAFLHRYLVQIRKNAYFLPTLPRIRPVTNAIPISPEGGGESKAEEHRIAEEKV